MATGTPQRRNRQLDTSTLDQAITDDQELLYLAPVPSFERHEDVGTDVEAEQLDDTAAPPEDASTPTEEADAVPAAPQREDVPSAPPRPATDPPTPDSWAEGVVVPEHDLDWARRSDSSNLSVEVPTSYTMLRKVYFQLDLRIEVAIRRWSRIARLRTGSRLNRTRVTHSAIEHVPDDLDYLERRAEECSEYLRPPSSRTTTATTLRVTVEHYDFISDLLERITIERPHTVSYITQRAVFTVALVDYLLANGVHIDE